VALGVREDEHRARRGQRHDDEELAEGELVQPAPSYVTAPRNSSIVSALRV
jgi:hypothetical protein